MKNEWNKKERITHDKKRLNGKEGCVNQNGGREQRAADSTQTGRQERLRRYMCHDWSSWLSVQGVEASETR